MAVKKKTMKRNSYALIDKLHKRNNDYSKSETKYLGITGKNLVSEPFSVPVDNSNPKSLSVSIIIPTYNSKNSLKSCLASIEHSSFNSKFGNKLQVIVVDDGSIDGTWKMIKNTRFSINLTFIKQNNAGQAQAFNTGFSLSEGEIIISCDSDMVLSFYTIEQLVLRHNFINNALFVGFRSELPNQDERVDSTFIKRYGVHHIPYFTRDERITYPKPGYPNNMCLASGHFKKLGNFKKLWMSDENEPWLLPDLVLGALFSVRRSLFEKITGFDERFIGWGCSDGFFAAKAVGNDTFIVPVYAATGFHVHHSDRRPRKWDEYKKNRERFFRLLGSKNIYQNKKWIIISKKRILETFTYNKSIANKAIQKSRNLNDEWNFIDSYLSLGEYSKAYELLTNKSKDKNSCSKDYLSRLAKIFYNLGNYGKSDDIYKNNQIYNLDFIMNLAALGEFKKANKTLKKLVNKKINDQNILSLYNTSSNRYYLKGKKYYDQKMYDVALRIFEEALIVDCNNNEAFKYRELSLKKFK